MSVAGAVRSVVVYAAIGGASVRLQVSEHAGWAQAVLGGHLLRRGIARMRTGDNEGAASDLVEAISILIPWEDRARAHLAFGLTLRSMGRHDEARAAFDGAAELAPNHPAGKMAERELAFTPRASGSGY